MKRNVKIICDSHKGTSRSLNKDGVLALKTDSYAIIGIFDGVSSVPSSHKAVKRIISYINNKHSAYFKDNDFDLATLSFDTNNMLLSSNINEPYTTCSLLYLPVDPSKPIKYLNIGDSRIYAVSEQFIDKLTTDDSDKYHRNVLIKYLGKSDLSREDFNEIIYNGPATKFLICSDGFYNLFENNNKSLLDVHQALNINHSFYIKHNISKIIIGHNSDDASYALVRCQYV
jgi:serine/threonine protein phosphatase PrpC